MDEDELPPQDEQDYDAASQSLAALPGMSPARVRQAGGLDNIPLGNPLDPGMGSRRYSRGPEAYDAAAAQLAQARADGQAYLQSLQQGQSPAQAYIGSGGQTGYQGDGGNAGMLQTMLEQMRASQEAQQAAINAAYDKSGPGESEKWLRIAAALAKPTESGSFTEALGNMYEALSGYQGEKRKNEAGRAAELAKLTQTYDLAGLKAAGTAAGRSGQVWSETLQRFIPKDRAVPLGTGSMGGRPVTKYSDGTIRIDNGNGTMSVYDAGGNKLGDIPAQQGGV